LEGLKVLSFGAFVAGNTVGKLLADMGADVVKIEPYSRPEVLRTPAYAIGPSAIEPSGLPNTVMYAALVRGARSLSIDLAVPEARPLFHRLVAEAEIVVENFGGKVLEQWGCAYPDLLEHNPRLVMLSLSGYGRSGPRAGYLAYASTICSYIGLTSAWGYSHGTLTDYVTSVSGALALIAALRRARSEGTPSYVDVAQIDAMAPVLAGLYLEPLNSDLEPAIEINRVRGSWLSGVLACRGYESWIAVDVEDADDWAALCAFLGRTDLIVTDYQNAEEHEPDLRAELEKWASNHSAYTAMHVMQKAGLAVVVVQSPEDIWRDPQLRVRDFPEVVQQSDLGPVTYPRSVQRWTGTPGGIDVVPPRIGEHTREILTEWLGIDEDELARLSSLGATFEAD
jgi:crotonobetainyl-CoA:carnitine CoA-transferase CaiB-like acyl-CoA transferase